MKLRHYSTALILSITTFSLFAQTQVRSSVTANGGTIVIGESNKITGTVGQSVIGKANNHNHFISSGFWQEVNYKCKFTRE
jgi:hypothetical protein